MTKAIARKKPKVTSACTRCTGLCCRYFALPLENPEDWKDYDDIRWFLCHEHTSVFVEDGEWYKNDPDSPFNKKGKVEFHALKYF